MPKVKKPVSGREKFSSVAKEAKKKKPPLWKGPERDGITYSMLSKFLVCRERFRLLVVEGLRPQRRFNHRLEYGTMFHLCEEVHKDGGNWLEALTNHCKELADRHIVQHAEILKWYEVCKIQFPDYIRHWKNHNPKKLLSQEEVFSIEYELPDGWKVKLRGKMDSLFYDRGLILQENKTKGKIDRRAIEEQLGLDLQTMMYLTAIRRLYPGKRIKGVLYNIIRRPLSGGKGTIKKHKPTKTNPAGETTASFYNRLAAYWREEPDDWFVRWNVAVSTYDLDRFEHNLLNPLLTQLCNWWKWVNPCLLATFPSR